MKSCIDICNETFKKIIFLIFFVATAISLSLAARENHLLKELIYWSPPEVTFVFYLVQIKENKLNLIPNEQIVQ